MIWQGHNFAQKHQLQVPSSLVDTGEGIQSIAYAQQTSPTLSFPQLRAHVIRNPKRVLRVLCSVTCSVSHDTDPTDNGIRRTLEALNKHIVMVRTM